MMLTLRGYSLMDVLCGQNLHDGNTALLRPSAAHIALIPVVLATFFGSERLHIFVSLI